MFAYAMSEQVFLYLSTPKVHTNGLDMNTLCPSSD